MQRPKEDIRKRILVEAEKVFLVKGFNKASMRGIADASRIGLSNIYNYFPSKDSIFSEIVKPVIDAFEEMLQEHHGRHGADIMEMRSDTYFRYVVEEYIVLLGQHRRLLVLLFFRSRGSSYERFREDFTDKSTIVVKQYFQEMKQKYPRLNVNVSDFFIHLHTAWMFTLFEELIMHRLKPKEVEQVIREYITFEVCGWRELMEI